MRSLTGPHDAKVPWHKGMHAISEAPEVLVLKALRAYPCDMIMSGVLLGMFLRPEIPETIASTWTGLFCHK